MSDCPYKDGLYKQLGILYKRRTDKEAGMDAFVSTSDCHYSG